MRIPFCSLFVDDQEKALKFYTEKMGFVEKVNVPAGGARWITVVSAEDPNGTQLVLEPNGHPAATTYQKALFADGIPATALMSSDIQKDYERLSALGVEFRQKPTQMGPVMGAIFDDTCGNLIMINQL
ncbi:VOC family protein [Myxococcus sp. CA051A]|uniref:VOC family protein n=1 Tax=unclassified Myxococcus TaxID=2648731 RepID=UPI00157AD72A|nr:MULTISPECIES: VOC family protein [unclassified Myxococcus]NTX03798.1 VOC family protein [Myxococcus sp. CA040A]NTX14041.1 VOC family protein [Myxococcus sp. CA056]NTX35572.1 VOC family protein [Myxococcus sp. CA033]NTX50768.1 VOC family protein [Myxococcus sp. CA039A]NTX62023.1 VOC family protein [Myxococcus sp. CA051A]